MENQNDNNEKNNPKDQARNLFFESGLTQAQIAELIGVSQKTVSLWMNEGKWKSLKEAAEFAPAVLIGQMTGEIAEIHNNIASREPGKRFATPQEAETRRKIMTTIKQFKEQQTTAVHTEVLTNFIEYVRSQNREDVRIIAVYADQYLRGEKKLGISQPFAPYSLPGQINIPRPAGLPANNPDANTPPGESTDSKAA